MYMIFDYKKVSIIFVFLVAFLGFGAHTTFAQGTTPTFFFIRDLKEGMSGEDVRELQKLLNRDADTRISGTGVGSNGQESTYFGKITKEAVIRFQNKHRNDVLRPVGLSSGTGNVGLWTRLKLNQLLINAQITETPKTITDSTAQDSPITIVSPESVTISSNPLKIPTLGGTSKDLELSSLSRYAAPAGATIILGGNGFSEDTNTVNFGSNKYKNVVSRGKTEIAFVIPSSMKTGRYDISVTTGGKTTHTMPFMVTVPNAVAPVVTKVEPATVKFGQDITVTGQNFTKTGNIVTTGLGIIRDLKSSDGTTLTFSIPLPAVLKDFKKEDVKDWPMKVYVVNENGISKPNAASGFIISL